MPAPATRRAGWLSLAAWPKKPRSIGGSTFAERPDLAAPDARIIWRADLDPGTLKVSAVPAIAGHPDAIDRDALAPWLTLVADASGEHVVLSDGWHHIRIDVANGSLAAGNPVIFVYEVAGIASAQPKILSLRRLVDLCRRRRFSTSLYPPDRRVERWILALRVHDAVAAGASQNEIAAQLFGRGEDVTMRRSDSLRSRVRRLVTDARHLAGGRYRLLMKQRS